MVRSAALLAASLIAALFVIAPSPCFALWDVLPVTPEVAKELGMEVRSKMAGANHVRVELEFGTAGALKDLSQVDLRIGEGDKLSLTAPLREDRSQPGRVVVSFTAANAELPKLTLLVYVRGGAGGTLYELSVKDFVVLKKEDAAGAKRQAKEARMTFPYFLPGSRIVLGEELVDEVNALDSKEKQIQFLIKILPPADQENKHLSDRQLYAIRLLSITDSDAVLDPLMQRFDFVHTGDGWPVVHAMARLGERSALPLLARLQQVAADRQKTAACGAALIELKGDRFPMFMDELKRRKDRKVSADVLNELLDQYRFAPND